MRKATFILMFCPVVAIAGGPKSTFPEPRGLDAEMQNIYHDIANVLSTPPTISSATIPNLTVSTVSFTVPEGSTFQAERCGTEIVYQVQTTSSTTIATTFVPSQLSGAITPPSSTSYIKIRMTGSVNPDTGQSALYTILRSIAGGAYANIGASSGFSVGSPSAGVNIQVPVAITTDDNPTTTSVVTYAVGFRPGSGGIATFGSNNARDSLILQACF